MPVPKTVANPAFLPRSLRNDRVIHNEFLPNPQPSAERRERLSGTLHLRFAAANRIIVEPGEAGGFNVSPRPRQRELERNFAVAVDALDHAAVLAMEIGGDVLDLTGVGA